MDQDHADKPPTKDTKGKGVATCLDDLESSPTERDNCSDTVGAGSAPPSLISRLGVSTSKLARDMIFRHEGSAAYVANSISSSKGETSRPAQSTGMVEASTYKSNPARETPRGTFKSTEARERNVPSESDFLSFLDGADMPGVAEPSSIQRCEHEQTYHPIFGHTNAIAATDGMDVVNLLESGYVEVEDTDAFLTGTGQESLRHHLFEDGDTWKDGLDRRQWENTLNFFPNPTSNDNDIQAYADLLGTHDLEEAKTIWINQWQRVLSSYTDEVWGELGPLVKVARDELTDLSRPDGEASPSHLKALHRLRQILNHIRGD
ncbi:hypothetical protein GGS26DRAFT_578253 [Hypomontagnella submonticulosa]|nr:hypothetical protein GGS26DRAFT_578253 [Hypomontagnella submonticulosa]